MWCMVSGGSLSDVFMKSCISVWGFSIWWRKSGFQAFSFIVLFFFSLCLSQTYFFECPDSGLERVVVITLTFQWQIKKLELNNKSSYLMIQQIVGHWPCIMQFGKLLCLCRISFFHLPVTSCTDCSGDQCMLPGLLLPPACLLLEYFIGILSILYKKKIDEGRNVVELQFLSATGCQHDESFSQKKKKKKKSYIVLVYHKQGKVLTNKMMDSSFGTSSLT